MSVLALCFLISSIEKRNVIEPRVWLRRCCVLLRETSTMTRHRRNTGGSRGRKLSLLFDCSIDFHDFWLLPLISDSQWTPKYFLRDRIVSPTTTKSFCLLSVASVVRLSLLLRSLQNPSIPVKSLTPSSEFRVRVCR